jgi:NADPH-dependent ferric siderophore reductase
MILEIGLREILYDISVNRNFTKKQIKELFDNEEVYEVMCAAKKRHKCRISQVRELVQDYTIRYYEFDDGEYCVDRYLHQLQKHIGKGIRGNK